jgi:hypothetical protein
MSAPRLLAPTTISGGVPTAGAGTLNTIALWTPDGNTLGNSLLTQAGTTISNSSGAIRATGTTAGAPAFTGADTDTGIYFPAANQMRFSTAGSPAISIDASQNVGIGTASPSAKLDIRGAARLEVADPRFDLVGTYRSFMTQVVDGANAAASYWRLYDITASANRIVCDASGNVGIGTASPNAILSVYNASTPTISLWNSSNFTRFSTNTNDCFIDVGLGGTAGALIFRRSSSATESARIDSSGNVGIATTPSSWSSTYRALQLNKGLSFMARDGGDVYINQNAIYDSGNAWKYVVSGTNASSQILMSSAVITFNRAAAGAAGAALTWVESLKITDYGNVHAASGTTTMTDGFFYIPAAAGAPTGTPTAISGRVPMYYDTTNDQFYIRNGANWRKVTLT